MVKSTKDIIAELRAHATSIERLGNYVTGAEYSDILKSAKSMREAADRLEKSTMTDAFAFSAKHVVGAELKWKVGFRAGIEAFRDAIADGSIDDCLHDFKPCGSAMGLPLSKCSKCQKVLPSEYAK